MVLCIAILFNAAPPPPPREFSSPCPLGMLPPGYAAPPAHAVPSRHAAPPAHSSLLGMLLSPGLAAPSVEGLQ
jgi:hypothetical protein